MDLGLEQFESTHTDKYVQRFSQHIPDYVLHHVFKSKRSPVGFFFFRRKSSRSKMPLTFPTESSFHFKHKGSLSLATSLVTN